LSLSETRGFVKNYTIAYSTIHFTKREISSNMFIVNGNITTTIIEELNANFHYSVQISANTGAGSGVLGLAVFVPSYGMHNYNNPVIIVYALLVNS